MAPGCRSALEPGCVGLKRRQQRIQLGVDGGQFQCPLLGLRLRLSRPNGQQNVRWARRILPSSQAGPNPLGENITFFLSPAQAAGAPTFCDAAESKQRSQPRGLRPLGQPPPELSELGQALLRADASGALQSKLQSSGAERHRAPPGVAAAGPSDSSSRSCST